MEVGSVVEQALLTAVLAGLVDLLAQETNQCNYRVRGSLAPKVLSVLGEVRFNHVSNIPKYHTRDSIDGRLHKRQPTRRRCR